MSNLKYSAIELTEHPTWYQMLPSDTCSPPSAAAGASCSCPACRASWAAGSSGEILIRCTLLALLNIVSRSCRGARFGCTTPRGARSSTNTDPLEGPLMPSHISPHAPISHRVNPRLNAPTSRCSRGAPPLSPPSCHSYTFKHCQLHTESASPPEAVAGCSPARRLLSSHNPPRATRCGACRRRCTLAPALCHTFGRCACG